MFKYIYFLSISFVVLGFVNGCKKDKDDDSLVAENVFLVNWNAGGSVRDGKSWNTAFHTIQEAIDMAVSSIENSVVTDYKEIWVAKGTYYENLLNRCGILLYGGFKGNETTIDDRDWKTNLTIIDGNQEGSVIDFYVNNGKGIRVDGFTIRNGNSETGGGINISYLILSGKALIVNNIIRDNIATGRGGGIYLTKPSTGSKIENNSFINNKVSGSLHEGGALFAYQGNLTIKNNVFKANKSTNGIINIYGCGGEILNNLFEENLSQVAHIRYISNIIFANNQIINNEEDGIFIYSSNPGIYNNTICYNGGMGINIWSDNSDIVNNIIAFNKKGIDYDWDNYLLLMNNCVFGNTESNYEGIEPGIADISVDPKLSSDFHLQSGSPCINSGNNSVVLESWMDMDGENRINAGQVDIGADEFY